MKFNDILNENQVNELGILKNIGSRFKGAMANRQAKKMQKAGISHSAKIADNLKKEFQQMVGGGMEPTYQNLIDFLADNGLEDLETIPNPTQAAAPSQTRIEPTVEDVGPKLSAIQIDTIIKDAVKKNYARIRAAQQGRTVRSTAAEPADQEEPAAEPQTAEPSAPAAPASPTINAAPVAGNVAAITKAYSMLDAREREELKKQLEIIDDQDRLASGTNESRTGVKSKFLGIDL